MYSAEIVPREVQAVRGPQVLPFLAEGVRQSRETAHLHSDREVLTLNDAGADAAAFRLPHDRDYLGGFDLSG